MAPMIWSMAAEGPVGPARARRAGVRIVSKRKRGKAASRAQHYRVSSRHQRWQLSPSPALHDLTTDRTRANFAITRSPPCAARQHLNKQQP